MLNSNSSSFSYFILGAYMEVGRLKYLYFVIICLSYVAVIIANTSIITVICFTRSLYEPMFLFLLSLFVNELYGSTGLFPVLLLQVLSDVHTVPAPLCYLQIFCLFSYVHIEFCNLAVMSYDRYVAICHPLEYNTRMSATTVMVLIAVVWFYSFVKFFITLCLNLRLTLCGNVINGLYCHNYLVVKLACSDVTVNNIYGLFGAALTVLVPLLPILYSYMKILRVCSAASTQTRRKAVSTCTPQLTSLLNFSFGCLFEILQSRLDRTGPPSVLQLIMSLYFPMLQPLLNPLMFGLQLSKIRNACKARLWAKKRPKKW
ncbi:olfactory receptor 10A6-like, partial [Cololabis saira]|uniref:olfactory receptor 10A6-like n=1 Tax=Cololabis saira TaxID=129043 RepID=UPI002AD42386